MQNNRFFVEVQYMDGYFGDIHDNFQSLWGKWCPWFHTILFISIALLIITGHYSKMGDSSVSNGLGAVTRVLFCGPYWPAATNYTREYLQDYPFIQVSCTLYMVDGTVTGSLCSCLLGIRCAMSVLFIVYFLHFDNMKKILNPYILMQ